MPHLAKSPWNQPANASLRSSPGGRVTLRVVAILATALAPALARAEVEWHADLATAHAAARISHRPVLAVFVANWGEEANSLERKCLGSREAEAVLATCFEPVRIDIDEHEALTRAVGVTHVPTACVLAADDTVLTSFEMSGPPAAFVTAAILAAQRAANAEPDAVADGGNERDTPTAAASSPMTAAAFGSHDDVGAGHQRTPRGSMARVAAKVRDLSAFATSQSRPVAAVAPATIAPASQTVSEPRNDYRPLSWPAETASAAPTAPAPPPPTTIEPTATAMTPSTVSPWLDSAARQPPAAPPAATVQAPAQRPATPLPQPAAPPQQSSLIAALQKPFGFGGKPAAEPPTMPPAHPRSPLAATTPVTPPAASQADSLPATDTAPDIHGSMPLGLEGYCPVTLVDRGSWTEGRAQWGARHRGRTYLFAGPDEQRTFLADPDRYAPALSGDDPVLALDRGSSTPGQRRYGVTYQSRIYLFATPESRTAFTADPARYTTRVAVAERTPAAAGGTRTY